MQSHDQLWAVLTQGHRLVTNAVIPAPPAEIRSLLAEKRVAHWTGKVVLNIKDGEVLSYEVSETKRINRGDNSRM
jgi:hypothetical protein